jgi:hypothetical protein
VIRVFAYSKNAPSEWVMKSPAILYAPFGGKFGKTAPLLIFYRVLVEFEENGNY